MTDVRAIVQDLRAEAHRAPADIAQLMRRAADALAIGGDLIEREAHERRWRAAARAHHFPADPTPAADRTDDVLETYEQGADGLS